MNGKELTDEEKDAIKRVIDILFNLVSNKRGHAMNMVNDDPRTRKRVGAVAMSLSSTFVWVSTKEGEDYWRDVRKRLDRIAEEGW